MCDKLTKLGIPNTLILDSSVGYMMAKVDCVFMGAEGVVESGGIVNKVWKAKMFSWKSFYEMIPSS